jgi:NAD(P)-dependent dehydrogenase (short-subunit alcohol dehydrogenase family)
MTYHMKPSDGFVWITGASSGIGRAVALELAHRGFRVAVTARRREALDELTSLNANIHAYPGDVTDRDKMASIVSEIESAHGPIMLAFLNAGLYLPAERNGFLPEIIAKTFDVNIGGTVNSLAPVLEAMRKRHAGQIVITSSLAGYGGIPGSLAYCATKSALISMAETLRLTTAADGINVQVVNPGFVATAMTSYDTSFEMPFLMTAEAAAIRVCDGFQHGGFEITFPRVLAWSFKFARLFPYPLFSTVFLRLMRRTTWRLING